MQEKESIMVFGANWKFRLSASLVMLNIFPCDQTFNLHLITMKVSYSLICIFNHLSICTIFSALLLLMAFNWYTSQRFSSCVTNFHTKFIHIQSFNYQVLITNCQLPRASYKETGAKHACRSDNKLYTKVKNFDHMSHVMRKPVYVICEQQKHRSVWAFVQSDQHLCCSQPR